MPEIHLHHHQQEQQQLQQQQQQLLFHQSRPATNSRLGGMKGSLGGEIVEVQGGHIVRSTGRKDRHSKVCTAKGPRDRRVRLSAHTAIQFYDVQDRLGYDRPSKAVDWLIRNAKAAIDELAELPPWHPTATNIAAGATSDPSPKMDDSGKKGPPVHVGESAASSAFSFGGSSSFLPPSLESDAIADTIKFFFPIASGGGGGGPSSITTAAAPSSSTPTGFHQYPPDLLSRSNSHVQDLRLSLQSFQDPILLHHHHHHHQQHPPQQQSTVTEQSLFGNSPPTWSEQNQRLLHWSGSNETGGGSTTTTITAASGGGASSASYMLNQMSQPQGLPLPLHPVLGQSPFLTQRGPLQSNNSPSILAWTDPAAAAAVMSGSSTGFASGSFSGFRIPARIQGEEEHDDGIGISRKPSSAPRR